VLADPFDDLSSIYDSGRRSCPTLSARQNTVSLGAWLAFSETIGVQTFFLALLLRPIRLPHIGIRI